MRGFRNILSRRTGRLAADVSAEAVRLLGLADGRVATAVSVPAEGNVGTTAALRSAVRAAGLRGNECRVTLPSRLFRMETANMPPMSEPERARSANFEAMDRFGLNPESSIVRHAVLGEDAREVLLMAADTDVLARELEPLIACGLLPCSVEPASWAALRGAMTWVPQCRSGRVAFLMLERGVASLAMLQEGVVESFRALHGQWGQLTAASAVRRDDGEGDLSLEPEADGWRWSALAEEIVRCTRSRGSERAWPDRLVLAGTGCDDRALRATLGGVCGVPVEVAASDRWMPGEAMQGDVWAAAFGSAGIDQAATDRRAA
jgi:hypothetical protein